MFVYTGDTFVTVCDLVKSHDAIRGLLLQYANDVLTLELVGVYDGKPVVYTHKKIEATQEQLKLLVEDNIITELELESLLGEKEISIKAIVQ